ncbi:MAG: TlpA disulfide reductase family protein [Actinobacteria bacterium]|nr:TlpA disulfide reductase family protein [Actinomycetota bacterium]
MLLTGVFVGVVVAGLLVAWLLGDVGGAAEEDIASDFTVELLGGGSFTLSEHLEDDGRPLVLNLWASWCPSCRTEMPEISAYADANPDIAVLGVAVEDRWGDAFGFANEVQVSFRLGFGDDQFRVAYPSFGLPTTFFINPDGTISNVINGIVTEESLSGGFG